MIEEVTDKAVGVTLIHCKRVFDAWAKDTGSKGLRKIGNIRFVSGREINKSRKMCCNGIESSNIVQPKLAKCRLKNLDPRSRVRSFSRYRIGCSISGSGVDGFDDFINLRRNKGI